MGIMKASLSTIHHSKPSTVTPGWAGGAGCRVTDEMVFCGFTFPAQTPDRDVCADVRVPTQTLAAVSACGRGYGGTDPFIMRSEYIIQPAACHHQLHLHAAPAVTCLSLVNRDAEERRLGRIGAVLTSGSQGNHCNNHSRKHLHQ